jgi:hypothetical protein
MPLSSRALRGTGQDRVSALPLWSEDQHIGSGAAPHAGAKGLGMAAKRPVRVALESSEGWSRPRPWAAAWKGTTKRKSMRRR